MSRRVETIQRHRVAGASCAPGVSAACAHAFLVRLIRRLEGLPARPVPTGDKRGRGHRGEVPGTCAVTPGGAGYLVTGTLIVPGQTLRAGQVAVDGAGEITCVACNCSASEAGATTIDCPTRRGSRREQRGLVHRLDGEWWSGPHGVDERVHPRRRPASRRPRAPAGEPDVDRLVAALERAAPRKHCRGAGRCALRSSIVSALRRSETPLRRRQRPPFLIRASCLREESSTTRHLHVSTGSGVPREKSNR